MKALAVIVLLLMTLSVAQAIDVTVYGTIRDDNTQAVLENVQVKLYRNSAYYSQRYTLADGSYSFTGLPHITFRRSMPIT